MKLSKKWLAEFTDIEASPKEYADAMTLSGSKVEAIQEPAKEYDRVVVGRITSIERHPDSDHMWICRVDVGDDADIQIVTGAQNLNAGNMVPVALHDSTLPGGLRITKGMLRGVESNGMLCSLKELSLDLHDFPYAVEDGIFVLQEDCVPGDDIRPIIGADDVITEFEITNNRPDCLSVIGLARESAVTFDKKLRLHKPAVKGSGGNITELLTIEIQNASLCPRYTAKMIKNIKIEPSPRWLRQRLRALGVRPINNIVDITNYVMLEYGQPMHAFDYACLSGSKIIVRTAHEGEHMQTLDGTERVLSEEMLVIADAVKPVGVAGVMGGENSEINESTKYAVFESANFYGTSIRRTAIRLGMRTDASSRFEKGLDQENTLIAVERACELVEMLGAGEVIDGVIDVIAQESEPRVLMLRPERINALLGTDIPVQFMKDTLSKLGFDVNGDAVTVPSWRGDVEHYSDLAEEIARFYGYNEIEPTMLRGTISTGGRTARQSAIKRLGELCRTVGLSEVITYSFISPSDYDKICMPDDHELRAGPVILNPLGEDTSVMRTTSLPSMFETLARNASRRNENVHLYELAAVYREKKGEVLPDERLILTIGAYGNMDFLKLKGCLETIFTGMRISDIRFEAAKDIGFLHPGRSASITSNGLFLGLIGQIHPVVSENYGLPETYTAELDVRKMLSCVQPEPKYAPIPRYPSIMRDIAVVCDEEVTIGALTECIRSSGGDLLKKVELFDIYRGSHIAEGKKSTAFSLMLRSDDKTLTDEYADETVNKILLCLKKELGAVIR